MAKPKRRMHPARRNSSTPHRLRVRLPVVEGQISDPFLGRPWEHVRLPLKKSEDLYECAGRGGWHSILYNPASRMRWMWGEPGTQFPMNAFYCEFCIVEAEMDARLGKRAEVILGLTLHEELDRRGSYTD